MRAFAAIDGGEMNTWIRLEEHVFTSERMTSSLLMHLIIRRVVIDMSEAIEWRIRDGGPITANIMF